MQVMPNVSMLSVRTQSQPNTSTSFVYAVGLSTALSVMFAGGVQTTTANTTAAAVPKGKAAVHLLLSGEGAKVIKGAEASGSLPQWVQDLTWIKRSSDVTVSRLAELFGVTRKAFYGWTEGAEPKKGGSLARITALRDLLDKLPSDLHRTALLNLADEKLGGNGLSLRAVLQGHVEEDGYRERLNGKLAELSPALDAAVKRLSAGLPATAAFENEFPTA